MKDEIIIPNFDWYSKIGKELGLPPRCPFASVDRCPRYFYSRALMGDAGATKIEPAEDKRLSRKWQYSSLAPATAEEDTSITRSGDRVFSYSNFCPEVSFNIFRIFASAYRRYADEIDTDFAHERLAAIRASRDDWRWQWSYVSSLHYTECPLYSLLTLPEKRAVPVDLSIFGMPLFKLSLSPWWSKFLTASFFGSVARIKALAAGLRAQVWRRGGKIDQK
jgi:hypothetical protein